MAEVAFRKALELSRAQHARGLELRAATELARLGSREGGALLAPLLEQFTEGHDTQDVGVAKALLPGASQPPSGP